MKNESIAGSPRIEVVDALRGFAVMAIIFLHNIEHFNLYIFPEDTSPWLKVIDGNVWRTLFFLFGGKAYAIFSLLFGFSFYIQLNNQVKKGGDFCGRFLWRLFLLFCLGVFNALFFPGDILVLYSIIGITLLPVRKWSDKAVLVLAVFLILQPLEWGKFVYGWLHPDYVLPPRASYIEPIFAAMTGRSFWELIKTNVWYGQLFSLSWAWYNGRFFQTSALFMLGMWLGRKQYFTVTEQNLHFWKKTLAGAVICFIPLFLLKESMATWILRENLRAPLTVIISSLSNFAFMGILVSLFVQLWQNGRVHTVLKGLVPYGKMSLTNYISQSVVGSFLYFGYGLGLYKYFGPTYSFLAGIALFVLQLYFCHWWLARHKQGPFERAWKQVTWIKKKG